MSAEDRAIVSAEWGKKYGGTVARLALHHPPYPSVDARLSHKHQDESRGTSHNGNTSFRHSRLHFNLCRVRAFNFSTITFCQLCIDNCLLVRDKFRNKTMFQPEVK